MMGLGEVLCVGGLAHGIGGERLLQESILVPVVEGDGFKAREGDLGGRAGGSGLDMKTDHSGNRFQDNMDGFAAGQSDVAICTAGDLKGSTSPLHKPGGFLMACIHSVALGAHIIWFMVFYKFSDGLPHLPRRGALLPRSDGFSNRPRRGSAD